MDWEILLADASLVPLALLMLLVAKISLDFLTPYKVDDQLTAKDNPAFGLSLVGYYLGVLIVFCGAISGESVEEIPLWQELATDAGWAAFGIVLLNISRVILDKVALPKFSTRKEIIEDRNCGMGAVEFGTYIGSALVIAGAVSGQGGGYDTALAFYAAGQLGLVVFTVIYEKMTSYSIHEELEKDNVAAGVAYGGNVIAMGILMLRGTKGDFVSWSENLSEFAFYACMALVLLVVGRYCIDLLLLPKRTLHQEIAEDQNLNAGMLEGLLLAGFAGVMFFAL